MGAPATAGRSVRGAGGCVDSEAGPLPARTAAGGTATDVTGTGRGRAGAAGTGWATCGARRTGLAGAGCRGGAAIAVIADARAAAAAAARSLRFFQRAIAPFTSTIAMKMIVSVFIVRLAPGA